VWLGLKGWLLADTNLNLLTETGDLHSKLGFNSHSKAPSKKAQLTNQGHGYLDQKPMDLINKFHPCWIPSNKHIRLPWTFTSL
jgi:hypothetical protein